MISIDGEEWLSTAEACEMLGPDITPAIVRDWRRRGLLTAQAIREGRATVAYHRRTDLVRVEHATRTSRGGRRRLAGVLSEGATTLDGDPTPMSVGEVCP